MRATSWSSPRAVNQKALNNDLPGDPALGGIIVSGPSYELSGGNGLKLAANSSSRIEEDFRVDSLEGGGTIELGGGVILTVGPRGRDPLEILHDVQRHAGRHGTQC